MDADRLVCFSVFFERALVERVVVGQAASGDLSHLGPTASLTRSA